MRTHAVPGRPLALALSLAVALPAAAAAQAIAEPVDLAAIQRIEEEGRQRSQVMEIMSWLTDVHGPRLSGSPWLDEAADWTVETLRGWGLQEVDKETWGEFGRGWTNEHFEAHLVEPRYQPLIGYPKAWTPGTGGPVRGEAVLAVIREEADLEALRAMDLRGKFVLTQPMPEVEPLWEPQAERYTMEELAELAAPPEPRGEGRGGRDFSAFRAMRELANQAGEILREKGVAAVLEPARGSGGTVFVSSGGSRDPGAPEALPQVALAVEHYGRVYRILEKGLPVTLELDVRNRFHDQTLTQYNVVGEIPGGDLAEEVVMLGGHFDSWHAGTGATDNAAGSAVMMEAMRILKATGLPLRRTVRIALWTGEEQGLLGSRAYARTHFGNPAEGDIKPEHATVSAYFNVDNGGGAIRGVYLQGNEAVRPIFQAWMEPFRDDGMTTLTIRDTGGTDHLAFDAVGIPGFQFIQDGLEYGSRTHHSSMDVYERIVPEDMIHNAVIVAAFVYLAANRDDMLPREPLPGRATSEGGR